MPNQTIDETEIDHRYCARSVHQPEPLPGLGRIETTVYMRPNGRAELQWTDRPIAIANKAHDLIVAGFRFEAEILVTNQVHCDVSHPKDEVPIANMLVSNGPGVGDAFDEMVTKAWERWKEADR